MEIFLTEREAEMSGGEMERGRGRGEGQREREKEREGLLPLLKVS